MLASRLGAVERGGEIVTNMGETIEEVERAVAGCPRRRLFFAEWIDPPFCAGHWLPEMIRRACGIDVLGVAGAPSYATTWERVIEAEPEPVVIGPCRFDADQAAERATGLEHPFRHVAVDADSYYSRPARLADGVRQLGHLLHPDAVPDPGMPAIERRGAWNSGNQIHIEDEVTESDGSGDVGEILRAAVVPTLVGDATPRVGASGVVSGEGG